MILVRFWIPHLCFYCLHLLVTFCLCLLILIPLIFLIRLGQVPHGYKACSCHGCKVSASTCSEFRKYTNRCLPTLNFNIFWASPCLIARVLSESWPPSSMPQKETKTCKMISSACEQKHGFGCKKPQCDAQMRSPGRNWPSSHMEEPWPLADPILQQRKKRSPPWQRWQWS